MRLKTGVPIIKTHSEAHTNFENLLRRVVSVPHSEVKRRMDEDRAARDRTKERGEPATRSRPVVSPASVSPPKRED
jgi:hypothetical protein